MYSIKENNHLQIKLVNYDWKRCNLTNWINFIESQIINPNSSLIHNLFFLCFRM